MLIRILPVLFLCCFFVGCGSKGPATEVVKGVVTLDGQPQESVTVKFFPSGEGEMGFALTDKDGQYSLSMIGASSKGGVMAGEYKIAFTKQVPDPSFKPKAPPKVNNPEEGADVEEVEIPYIESLPKKYTNVATSGFTVQVEKGGNTHNFELKSK
jgi:hypothetical protein